MSTLLSGRFCSDLAYTIDLGALYVFALEGHSRSMHVVAHLARS